MRYKLNSWSEMSPSLDTLMTISLYYETDDKLFYIEGRKQDFRAEDSGCIEFGTQYILFTEKTDSFGRAFFTWWRVATHHPYYQRNLIKYVELRKARETMDAVKKLPARQLYFDI